MQRRLAAIACVTLWLAGGLIENGGRLGAQESQEKTALRIAVRALLTEVRPFTQDPQPLQQSARMAIMSLEWLIVATEQWQPKNADEGRPMRDGIERMERAFREARNDAARRRMLPAIADDLADKVALCRMEGLAATRQVRVVTKRGAVAEVSGLEVLYLEKFFENDAKATPKQFRGFSSPAVDDLAPGRYVFWARQPGPTPKDGPRKESRIAPSSPSGPIEVLAP